MRGDPQPRLAVARRSFLPPAVGEPILFVDPYTTSPQQYCTGTVAVAPGMGGLGDGQVEVDVSAGGVDAALVVPASFVQGRLLFDAPLPSFFAR